MKLLHIIATPREDESRTLKLADAFLDTLKDRAPNLEIDVLNLFKDAPPSLTLEKVSGKYTLLFGKDLSGEEKEAWEDIKKTIDRFMAADTYLISTPMWNFSIPYILKNYIDVIVQPKYLFKYTDKGPVGLAKNKKMVVLTSRGSDYSPESPFHPYDFQEPYLRAIFGFIGITDIKFVNAQPMDSSGEEARKAKLEEAIALSRNAAATL